jgi:hypothetical protein
MAFGSIPFRPISPTDQAPSRCFSRGGVIVRGTPTEPIVGRPARPLSSDARPLSSAIRSLATPTDLSTSSPLFGPVTPMTPRYVPPHRRTHSCLDRPTR